MGGQNFWIGLIFTQFSVDLKKKKVIAPIWSTFLRVLCWFPKKKTHHLETAARESEVWVGMQGSLRGQNFCLGGRRSVLPLPSCGPVLSPYQKLGIKNLKTFFSKNNLTQRKLKICRSKLQQNNAINVADNLSGCFFTQKTFEKKIEIVTAGRPKPKLKQLINIHKHGKRRFSVVNKSELIKINK